MLKKIFYLLAMISFLDLSSSLAIEKHIFAKSCATLNDGSHLIQPMDISEYNKARGSSDSDEEPPIVEVTCSKGYTIIDPNHDPNIVAYFSSYQSYHSSFAGPHSTEPRNWEEWWLPSVAVGMDNTIFRISEDCVTISDAIQSFDDTTYYMTGDNFGCQSPVSSMCDFDEDTLECYQCTPSDKKSDDGTAAQSKQYWGKCGHIASSKNTAVISSQLCTESGLAAVLPSIGTLGRFCVAYKHRQRKDILEIEGPIYPVEDTDEELFNPISSSHPHSRTHQSLTPLFVCGLAFSMLILMGLSFAYYQWKNSEKSSLPSDETWSVYSENYSHSQLERQPMLESYDQTKYVLV